VREKLFACCFLALGKKKNSGGNGKALCLLVLAVGKKKNTIQNRRARGLVEKLVVEKFFFLIAAFLLWVKVVVGKGRGKIGIGELHFFKPADVSFAPYLEPKETVPCFFVGECEGVCRTPSKALFVNLHFITTHSTTLFTSFFFSKINISNHSLFISHHLLFK
jgi:hypothetical protein